MTWTILPLGALLLLLQVGGGGLSGGPGNNSGGNTGNFTLPVTIYDQTADPGYFPTALTVTVKPPASQPINPSGTGIIGANIFTFDNNMTGDYSANYGIAVTAWHNAPVAVTDIEAGAYINLFHEAGTCTLYCYGAMVGPEIDGGSATTFGGQRTHVYVYGAVGTAIGEDIGMDYGTQPTNSIGLRIGDMQASSSAKAVQTGAGLVDFGDRVHILPTLFSSLPTCTSGIEGTMRPVTDATTNTWGAVISGLGTDHVLAYCDGTSWTVAAK